MYNRYIPQPDGTYRKDRVTDPIQNHPPRQQQKPEPQPAPCQPTQETPCPPPEPANPTPPPCKQNVGIDSFLRQLLPSHFDTGDLMIVLLLLLMAGDSGEDKSTALLTLVLYLFL